MKTVWKVARVVLILAWVGVCTHLLLVGLEGLRNPSDPKNLYSTFVFYQGIRVVGFPLGFAAWYLVYGVFALGAKPSPEMQMWIMWLVVMAAGYFQWFHLVPWLFRQFMESRKRAALQLQ
jgi:hypothetical protein